MIRSKLYVYFQVNSIHHSVRGKCIFGMNSPKLASKFTASGQEIIMTSKTVGNFMIWLVLFFLFLAHKWADNKGRHRSSVVHQCVCLNLQGPLLQNFIYRIFKQLGQHYCLYLHRLELWLLWHLICIYLYRKNWKFA